VVLINSTSLFVLCVVFLGLIKMISS
jgi:hypothetical protein